MKKNLLTPFAIFLFENMYHLSGGVGEVLPLDPYIFPNRKQTQMLLLIPLVTTFK